MVTPRAVTIPKAGTKHRQLPDPTRHWFLIKYFQKLSSSPSMYDTKFPLYSSIFWPPSPITPHHGSPKKYCLDPCPLENSIFFFQVLLQFRKKSGFINHYQIKAPSEEDRSPHTLGWIIFLLWASVSLFCEVSEWISLNYFQQQDSHLKSRHRNSIYKTAELHCFKLACRVFCPIPWVSALLSALWLQTTQVNGF